MSLAEDQWAKAQAIALLITHGFTPESVVEYIATDDVRKLKVT